MKDLCWQVRMQSTKAPTHSESNGVLPHIRRPPNKRNRMKKRISTLLHTHVALIILCSLAVLDAVCVIGQIICDILIMKDELREKELLEEESKRILFETFPEFLNKTLHGDWPLQSLMKSLKDHGGFFHHHEHDRDHDHFNSIVDTVGPTTVITNLISSWTKSTPSPKFNSVHSHDHHSHDHSDLDHADDLHIRHKRGAGGNHQHHFLDAAALRHHYILHEMTHAFHLGSMVILTLLMIETFVKIFIMGKKFLSHKIEVFDSFVITVSWCLDIAFWEGLWAHPEAEAANIMIFILPWRVTRVVNSFVLVMQQRDLVQLKILKQQYRGSQKRASDLKMKVELYRVEIGNLRTLAKKKGANEKEIQGCAPSGGRRRRSSLLPVLTRLASIGLMSVNSTTDLLKSTPSEPKTPDLSDSEEEDSGYSGMTCSRQSSASDDISLSRTISNMSTSSDVSTIALSRLQSINSLSEDNPVFTDENGMPAHRTHELSDTTDGEDNLFTKL